MSELIVTETAALQLSLWIVFVSLLFALGAQIVCGAISANVAGKKGRKKGGYFCLGFFFGILGIIVALVVDDLTVTKRRRRVIYEEFEEDEEEDDEDEYY